MYEGAPNFPDFGRFWAIIERHSVSIFYTAPTAIRAFMRAGREWSTNTISRRCACWAPSASRSIPRPGCGITRSSATRRCPIVDTWWQTETGVIMITPLPGVTPTKPGTATLPFFGVDAAIVDRDGKELAAESGRLAGHPQAVAVDAARDLQRPGSLRPAILERSARRAISPGTALAAMRTDISGSWAASTM